MCRRLRRPEGGISDALRIFRGKLESAQERSFCLDEVVGKIPERKNPRVDREKCSTPGDRSIDRFAGELPETTAQHDRENRRQQWSNFNSTSELRSAFGNY